MILNIPHWLILSSPCILVFLILSAISIFKYKDMSSGGGDAGMIGAMMCFAIPVVLTLMWTVPYAFAILMYKLR